ncbi:uncharacterized protein LOC131148156 [Malania oleifera]|uniref:uncharacterized protein LOC131148156 n=1 Tax=Malania oleifera TaxID=397392 RepID=UPI0025AE7991|nr:uncharacterized protein LOC131148156 [Malania oleifera]
MAGTSSSPTASPPALWIRPPTFIEGKLDGTNYTLWKFKMSAILDSYKLLVTAQGMDLEPIDSPDPTNPKVIIPLDAAFVKAWKRRNVDALCAIVTSVSDSMAAVDIAKTSKELARRCIRVLPSKYDSLVTALSTQIRTPTLTFEEFCALLLEEEMRLRIRENESNSAFIMQIKGKGNNVEKKKGKNKKRFYGICYYCKKKGHATKDCRKRIHDEKNGTLKPTWNVRQVANCAEP